MHKNQTLLHTLYVFFKIQIISETLGWSDLALYTIFEIGYIAADQVYFLSSIPKYRQIFPRARRTCRQSLIFKNQRILKN